MPIDPAQLEFVWLSRLDFEADPAFDRTEAGGWNYVVAVETDIDALTGLDPDEVAAAGDETDTTIAWSNARLRASIEWTRNDREENDADADERPPFRLEIEVSGSFVWRFGTAPEERLGRLWLEYNAQYLLWPYLRQHVAAITTASNVPALTIYTLNVPARPVVDEDSTEDVTGDASGASETSGDPENGEPTSQRAAG